jgi:hypothetical protein
MSFSATSLLAMELEEFEQRNQLPDRHNTVTNIGTTSSSLPPSPPPPPDSPTDRNEPLSYFSSFLDDEDDEDTNGFHEFTSGAISEGEPLVSFSTFSSFSTTSPLASLRRHDNDQSDYDEQSKFDERSLLDYESDSDAHEFSKDDEDYPQFHGATGYGHAYNKHHEPSTTSGLVSSKTPTHDPGVGPIPNLNPAEQYLASLVVQRNLPKEMYKEFSKDDEDYPQFHGATGYGHAYNKHHEPSTTSGLVSSKTPTHDPGVGPIPNLNPAEQYLASLVVQRNLPKEMYKELWDWWFFTHHMPNIHLTRKSLHSIQS